MNHRRVRRQEEIIWIREQGFTHVVSLIAAAHNLHNYDELGVAWIHRPQGPNDDPVVFQRNLYVELRHLLANGEKLLVHQEEVGDRVCGLVAGYLLWAGLVPVRAAGHLGHRAADRSPARPARARARGDRPTSSAPRTTAGEPHRGRRRPVTPTGGAR